MASVLFVCTGNICRSPLAHAVFEHRVRELGLQDGLEAESAGTHAYHVGEQADPRTCSNALRHGVRLDHRARAVSPSDFDRYDLILALDRGHLKILERYCHGDAHRKKLRLYRDFDPEGAGDVPDPYYGGDADFELVWNIVDRCTMPIITHLTTV